MSVYQQVAAVRFSAADVRGDGPIYLATKCSGKFIVLLFQDEDKAEDRWRQWRTVGCGRKPYCIDAHYRGILMREADATDHGNDCANTVHQKLTAGPSRT